MAGDLLWALFFGVLGNLIGAIQIWQNRRRQRARGVQFQVKQGGTVLC
jgi:hypothetical protein